MKQTLQLQEYPVYSLEVSRKETSFGSVDEIADYFKQHIEAHRYARFIAEFDHYAHTSSLPEGRIDKDIRAAKNVVFCFGLVLPDPQALAVRPKSIGIAETGKGFVITFMEAPMPVANTAIEEWVAGLCDRRGETR